MTALLGRGEAHALLARALPRALGGRVQVVVARGHRPHDGEKMWLRHLVMLQQCSNGVQSYGGTSCTYAWPQKFTGATKVPSAARRRRRGRSVARERGAREPRAHGAKHHNIIVFERSKVEA